MKRLIFLLSVVVPALAVYTYTTIDTLTSANSTTWQSNGSPTYTGVDAVFGGQEEMAVEETVYVRCGYATRSRVTA